MKIVVCCNSDHLALPTILALDKAGILETVCIPSKSESALKPLFQSIIPSVNIVSVDRKSLHEKLVQFPGEESKLLLITFPWYIEEKTCTHFKGGAFNVHFSSLPKYAGKDPVFWQLIHETKIGFTIHEVTQEIDGGAILFQKDMPIIPGEHYGLITQRLGQFVASTYTEWIDTLINSQDLKSSELDSSYWAAPTYTDLKINWDSQTAEEVQKIVAASNPKYGGANFQLNGETMKLLEVMLVDINEINSWKPGTVVFADNTHGLVVKCKNGTYLKMMIINSSMGYTSGVKLFQIGLRQGTVLS